MANEYQLKITNYIYREVSGGKCPKTKSSWLARKIRPLKTDRYIQISKGEDKLTYLGFNGTVPSGCVD